MLTDAERGEAVLVDAPHFVKEEIEPELERKQCSLVGLLLTHGHYDHMGGAASIQKMEVPVWGHKDDRDLYEDPARMAPYAYPPGLELEAVHVDHWIDEGDSFELMGLNWKVRHTPGHCPGNVYFYVPQLESVFVGDTLFAGGIGRWDLPGGDGELLQQMIKQRIYSLDEGVKVFPGHGPQTTVGQEKATNPYVQG
ncbi:MAG: MBL fold metallo-hydrolase [Symploca sp. SIO2D2]|nr:MBL fold metallo-hydrolase [Symploca sp. SIO2D2]